MNDEKNAQLQSTTKSAAWTSMQAYVMASFCLVLGVALGYLFRGSASPAAAQAAPATTAATQQGTDPHQQQSADVQAALTQAAAPLLEAVNRNPNDYESLVKLGNVFYDG